MAVLFDSRGMGTAIGTTSFTVLTTEDSKLDVAYLNPGNSERPATGVIVSAVHPVTFRFSGSDNTNHHQLGTTTVTESFYMYVTGLENLRNLRIRSVDAAQTTVVAVTYFRSGHFDI